MFALNKIAKRAVVASVALSTLRGSAICQDQVFNPKGLPGMGLPKFSKLSPSILENKVNEDIISFRNSLSKLNSSFDDTNSEISVSGKKSVEALESINNNLSQHWGLVEHLMSVKNSDELRKVQNELQSKVSVADSEIGQSLHVYNGLLRIRNDASKWEKLNGPQQRIIDGQLRWMKQSGVALEGAEKARFNELKLEAEELSTKFRNNVLDSTKSFSYKVEDRKSMVGVPEGLLALFSQRAISAGFKDSTASAGPWVITLDLPSYQACIQHIPDREVRKAVYHAFITRASAHALNTGESAGNFDNTLVMQRLLEIRYEMATMLGYKNYADLSLSRKMAGDIEKVYDLIGKLWASSISSAKNDLEDVRQYAVEHRSVREDRGGVKENEPLSSLELWDVPYYSERLREAKYGFKEEELKPYLALPNVLTGLFKLANTLFGVSIESVPTTVGAVDGHDHTSGCSDCSSPKSVEVWNKDVQFFTVKDSNSGKIIAAFYLDPYSRPEDKTGGAWMNVCLQRSGLFKQIPVAYLVCNGSPPITRVNEQGKSVTTPALMTFREVETLFHEFGHGLQHMLTTVEEGSASGIASIEWDAVELPSQFMENWCLDIKTLQQFARHYETGEVIPAEYIDKLKKAKNYQSGMQMIRQLKFGLTDILLHHRVPPTQSAIWKKFCGDTSQAVCEPVSSVVMKMWVQDIQNEVNEFCSVLPAHPDDAFLNSFSHIFAGGYAAGYYSYKWAEVMSADAFAAFEEVGLENREGVEELGRKFRATVLGLGGGTHPAEVYKLFRGRNPSTDALLRHSGLTK